MSFPLSIPMGKRHFLFYDVLLPIAGILLIGKLLALRFDGPIFHRLDSIRAFGLGYWFAHSGFRTTLWNASGYIFALIPAIGWAAWIRLNFEFDRAKGTFRLDRPIYRGSVSALRWFRRVVLPRFRKSPAGAFSAAPDSSVPLSPAAPPPLPSVAPSLAAAAPSFPPSAAAKPGRPAPEPIVIAPLRSEAEIPRLTLDPAIRPELPPRPDPVVRLESARAAEASPLADFAARLESARAARAAAPENRAADAAAGTDPGPAPKTGKDVPDDVMPPVPGASKPPPARPIAPGPAYPRRAR